MSLNQLVDPTNPLDITVNDLRVEGSFDIGTISFDDVLITGALTLTDLPTSSVAFINSSSVLDAATLANGQLLIGSSGAEPVVGSLTASTGISITSGAGSISLGVGPTVVLTDSKQTISGAKSFTAETEFRRLVSATGNNNVLITGSPNINVNSGNAVIIGPISDDQLDYSGSTIVGAAIAHGVPNVGLSTLVGSLITVDNNSSNNIVIGNNMGVSGNNQVVIGNSTSSDFYSLGSTNLGTSSYPWNTAHINNDLTLGNYGNLVFTGLAEGTQTFFHSSFTGDQGVLIPDLSGQLMINDAGSVSQQDTPETKVESNTYSTLIVTQPFNTHPGESTSFMFYNIYASPRSLVSVSSYSAAVGEGYPLVIISSFDPGVSMTITVINTHTTNKITGYLGITVLIL